MARYGRYASGYRLFVTTNSIIDMNINTLEKRANRLAVRGNEDSLIKSPIIYDEINGEKKYYVGGKEYVKSDLDALIERDGKQRNNNGMLVFMPRKLKR